MEAEYIALSQAMQDLIPLWALLQDIISITNITLGTLTTYSIVFEDNKSCVEGSVTTFLILRGSVKYIYSG